MTGIRVVELATWTFVPAAGAMLADWGADVIKIEHPTRPDPQRALRRTGDGETAGISALMEQANRGKRSLALDIRTEAGREALYRLVETADVFLTNWLPAARQKALVDVEHIRARNPRIVYVRGSGQGTEGPDAEKPGFDGTSYLARGGFARAMTPPGAEWPITGSSAVGDLPGSVTLAGAVCGGLFHRERTGTAPVVDVSLLGLAMWTISPDIVEAGLAGLAERPKVPREQNLNPVSVMYKTKDERVLKLSMFESDRFFRDLCQHLGCERLADDPRFLDAELRAKNNAECVAELDAAFGQFTLDELRGRFATLKGAWAPVQSAPELHSDEQAIANRYLPIVKAGGRDVAVVAPPMQFDGEVKTELQPCPSHGQHTEEILLDLGFDWPELIDFKDSGVIL